MSYLLDTNICIALLKGNDRELKQQFQAHAPGDFCLCSVVKAELWYGARKSERIEANVQLLEQFFAPFTSYGFDDEAATYYGTLRAILSRAGTPVGANDLCIASIALAQDLVVLTRSRREFHRIPGLRVESW